MREIRTVFMVFFFLLLMLVLLAGLVDLLLDNANLIFVDKDILFCLLHCSCCVDLVLFFFGVHVKSTDTESVLDKYMMNKKLICKFLFLQVYFYFDALLLRSFRSPIVF